MYAKKSVKNYRILTPREQEKLIEASKTHSYDYAPMLIKVCLYHGLRNEETVTLQVQHVKDDGIQITQENTKTKHGVRQVPTPGFFKDELHEYVNQFDGSESYIFPSNYGGHITTRTFRHIMLNSAVEAGLYPDSVGAEDVSSEIPVEKRVRPHCLRHTYGTERYSNGMPAKELSDVMGHSSITITMDMYAHLATERYRDSVDQSFDRAGVG